MNYINLQCNIFLVQHLLFVLTKPDGLKTIAYLLCLEHLIKYH